MTREDKIWEMANFIFTNNYGKLANVFSIDIENDDHTDVYDRVIELGWEEALSRYQEYMTNPNRFQVGDIVEIDVERYKGGTTGLITNNDSNHEMVTILHLDVLQRGMTELTNYHPEHLRKIGHCDLVINGEKND